MKNKATHESSIISHRIYRFWGFLPYPNCNWSRKHKSKLLGHFIGGFFPYIVSNLCQCPSSLRLLWSYHRRTVRCRAWLCDVFIGRKYLEEQPLTSVSKINMWCVIIHFLRMCLRVLLSKIGGARYTLAAETALDGSLYFGLVLRL